MTRAFVYGHHVSSSRCIPLSSIPDKLDQDSLKLLLSKPDCSKVCPKHPDHNFVEMLLSKKGKVMSRDGKDVVASIDSSVPVNLNGDIYTHTVRRSTCEILTSDVKCEQCVIFRDTLRKSFHRWKKGTESLSRHQCTASTSHTNLHYLNTPEKQRRYQKLKVRSDTAERKVKKMMERLTIIHLHRRMEST